jgi:two-component system sensor histidine kinase KdpD
MTKEPDRAGSNARKQTPQPGETSGKRGKFRIFLGYAAGAGKTYTMLEVAQRRKAEGADVVAAYVETHGYPETDALLKGLEIVPHRVVQVHGTTQTELDVDAVLARQPQIALIDDLSHTNPPDSRHPRRFQDIEELLNAGIDVYTTVNVQHIESLNDVVAQITGVTIEETVPDSVFDQADQIELIDILPEDLLQRLQEGPVQLSDQATAAMRKFFRPGNLTALRELAMRQTARRVDDQMRAYMQTRAIPGPWAASERLMICISSSPLSPRLVRTGYRLAQQLDARWHAVYVEAPPHNRLSTKDRARLNETMNLAEGLGAKVVSVTGQSVADTLLQYARRNNMTKIILGQPLRSRWQEWIRGSVVNRLIHEGGIIDIYVISSHDEPSARPTLPFRRHRFNIWNYLAAALLVTAATLGGSLLDALVKLNPANLVMFYLLAVVIIALWKGYGPAVMAAVLSVFVFNFFFVPPELTFHVTDAQYLLTFLGLLAAGVVIANLTSRAYRQTEAAQRHERETAQLYSLSRELSATVDPTVIVQAVLEHARHTFRCEAGIFLAQDDQLIARATTPGYDVDTGEHAAAMWAYEHVRTAGHGTDTMSSARARYIPLKTAQNVIGVLGFQVNESVSPEQQRLMDAFAAQSALGLEATQLGEEAQQARLLREKEKLQSALLNSISHDLRTPLVSITGTLSSLRDNDAFFDAAARRDLLDGAYGEAERLNRLVGNLLDMSRLESGSLTLKQELYDVQEVIGVARSQLRERLHGREVVIHLPEDLPLVSIDLSLFAQVIVNLLDNAVKYSEPDTPIEICARQDKDIFEIEIADHGVGIPEEEIPRIFEKFYRARGASNYGGSGLGLSICQGIVEAHGGTIHAENREGGGTCFIIRLPLKQTR